MPTIRVETDIAAPPPICFDLARSVGAHLESAHGTRERAISGTTSGLLGLGDEVTWRARHFGVTQELASRITAFDRPRHFQDSMVRGAFAHFVHDHLFVVTPTGTRMVDMLDYVAPLGPLGWIGEKLFLTAYLERFLRQRAQVLKELAESDGWRRFICEAG